MARLSSVPKWIICVLLGITAIITISRRVHSYDGYTDILDTIVGDKTLCADPTCTAVCRVDANGYAGESSKRSLYIKVDDIPHAAPSNNGLLLTTLYLGVSCKVKDVRLISNDNHMTLSKYFGSLPLGVLVVGVTGGGVQPYINQVAKFMGNSLSISLPTNLTMENTLYFRAMKGHPSFAKIVIRTMHDANTWITEIPLVSPRPISFDDVPLSSLEHLHSDMTALTGWSPGQCVPRWRIAIIVHFRDRETHLRIFTANIIPFLKKQNIAFKIFFIEQAEPELFNRAALMNVGYMEAKKTTGDFDCYIFHDVDLIPEDLCNTYSCSDKPRHLAAALDKYNYRLIYPNTFGGVTMLDNAQMEKINGFPNTFFGWGAEDDNINMRIHNAGYKVLRYPTYIGRYRTIPHREEKHSNPKAGRSYDISQQTALLYGKYDGINNMNYTVLQHKHLQLYSRITVRLPGPTNVDEEEIYFEKQQQRFKKMRDKDKRVILQI